MTVLEAIQKSTAYLERKEVESPRLQVEWMLEEVLKLPRLKLYLEFERPLATAEVDRLRELVTRRGNREPLQHILGTAVFCGITLKVTAHVLVPRPETEVLAEEAWTWLEGREDGPRGPGPDSDPAWRVLDVGTGSGCLGIALAARLKGLCVEALDVSAEALAVARSNVAEHQLSDRIHLVQGDDFSVLDPAARFDLIISNPPYIPSGEIAGLQPEVRDFEPRLALDGGADGLDHFRRLAGQGAGWLRPGGRIMVEFADGQESAVAALFQEAGWTGLQDKPDLSGRPRIFIACPSE